MIFQFLLAWKNGECCPVGEIDSVKQGKIN